MERCSRWAKCFGYSGALIMILATMTGCNLDEKESLTCAGAKQAQLDPFVSQRNCSSGSVVVTIRGDRPNSELWILEEDTATNESSLDSWLEGKYLSDGEIYLRSRALVQINGQQYRCEGVDCRINRDADRENPTTRVFESTHQISMNEKEDYPDLPLSFGPRGGSAIPIHLGDAGAAARYSYNVVGSAFPIIQGGQCSTWDWDEADKDVTVMGYGRMDEEGEFIVMAYVPKNSTEGLEELCKFMKGLGVTDAVMMDGGHSAGMYLNSSNAIGGRQKIGNFSRLIPYRIGLVTLESQNRVSNGDFESPVLTTKPGGTPAGFHSYAGGQMDELQWSGAAFLYDAPRYNTQRGTYPAFPPVASHGMQVAALRPRGLETQSLVQRIEVPANRYCMLHFAHGFHPENPGCSASESLLDVELLFTDRGREAYFYSSSNTTGLDEEWLRFTTAEEGGEIFLIFSAADSAAEGPCEVLLDDVSVSCAEKVSP